MDLPLVNISEQFNPVYVHSILQEFTEVEEVGFNDVYAPKNFMTQYILIIPNKLRPKTLLSSQSNLTGYYKVIVEELCPELEKIQKLLLNSASVIIEKGTTLINFNKFYDKLYAYYLLITDASPETVKNQELNLINKRDRTHTDQYISLLNRFKDKSKSIFSNGIIATRHNISCRTVMGGAFDARTDQVSVPEHIANKMCMLYPVYAQNLMVMKQLVASMATNLTVDSSKPRVLSILNGQTGKLSKLTIKDATTKASLLKPGDKLLISLITNDWVLHDRYPSIREESWSSFRIIKDKNSIISIPLPAMEMKSGDLDGDEAQMFAMYNHTTDLENLLLHSIPVQMIGYKHSKFLVWFEEDVMFGMQRIIPGVKLNYFNKKPQYEGVDVLSIVESFLPKGLTYVDSKTEIRDSHFVSNKTNMNNHELFKFIAMKYNTEICLQLMDNIIQLAYDINKDYGSTVGNDLRIHGAEYKKQIKEICDKSYEEIKEIELTTNKWKTVLQKNISEKQKSDIKKLLLESIKGTPLEFPKITEWRIGEYYTMVVQLDYAITGWESDRIRPKLADGSRTLCVFPKFSIDPCAYGYSDRGYSGDIRAFAQFIDCHISRYNIYAKKAFTADQGYLSKRLNTTFGQGFTDYNGQVIDGFHIISPQYGMSGINPRFQILQPLPDMSMNDGDFEAKYQEAPEIINLRAKIMRDCDSYRRLTNFIKTNVIEYNFVAGFNYEQFF
jgi:DNA-directed RNA polymerase beta' subunit